MWQFFRDISDKINLSASCKKYISVAAAIVGLGASLSGSLAFVLARETLGTERALALGMGVSTVICVTDIIVIIAVSRCIFAEENQRIEQLATRVIDYQTLIGSIESQRFGV